jgi:putative Holliday junction resolvase
VRALGLDLGSKRIGVAVSDGEGIVATPLKVVQRTGDRRAEYRAIASLVREWEVEVVVVGMPYSLDGSRGPMALRMGAEADELGARLGVPVETYDERLTTVTAERSLREQDLRGPERRRVVDMVAATVMLQAWLDGRRVRSSKPEIGATETGAPGTGEPGTEDG